MLEFIGDWVEGQHDHRAVGRPRRMGSEVVSDDMSTTIGSFPATAVDVRLAPSAPMEHADCPAPCVDFVGFEHWDHANGILGDDVYRFYLADIRYSGSEHVFSVTVEGRDEEDLQTFVQAVEEVLATVEIPARAG